MLDPLDLRNLWTPDFDTPEVCARRVAREAEQQWFKLRYGGGLMMDSQDTR